MSDHDVFKALADRNRRTLLDALRERDGRTLGELCELLEMSRYGVMKHLRILEACGLVVTRKSGRSKHHYLNPVPIQQVYERWVSRFAQPWAGTLTALKRHLEGETPMVDHVQSIVIRATPDAVWKALTSSEFTRNYYFGHDLEGTWEVGGAFRYLSPSGATSIVGEILEMNGPHRLVTTFSPLWAEGGESIKTRVTWTIEEHDGLSTLTLLHEGLDPESELFADISKGWTTILSGLKTLLETGAPMQVPAAQ